MTVSNQPTNEIDTEIERAAMARMLNLGHVLELVSDAFNDGTFAQQQFVAQRHQTVLHVGLEASDELDPLLKQLFKHGLGEIAFVTEQLAKQPLSQFREQLNIGTVSWRQTATKQFAAVVNHQMQFEAKAPTH